MNWYNGYSPQARARKLRAMHKQFPGRSHPCYSGPCHMCGDPDSPVAPHSEDYSEPFSWSRPAVYALCRTCHQQIHKRFANPARWEAYKLHLRRGGYGRECRDTPIRVELRAVESAIRAGIEPQPLTAIRAAVADCWWEMLDVRLPGRDV